MVSNKMYKYICPIFGGIFTLYAWYMYYQFRHKFDNIKELNVLEENIDKLNEELDELILQIDNTILFKDFFKTSGYLPCKCGFPVGFCSMKCTHSIGVLFPKNVVLYMNQLFVDKSYPTLTEQSVVHHLFLEPIPFTISKDDLIDNFIKYVYNVPIIHGNQIMIHWINYTDSYSIWSVTGQSSEIRLKELILRILQVGKCIFNFPNKKIFYPKTSIDKLYLKSIRIYCNIHIYLDIEVIF